MLLQKLFGAAGRSTSEKRRHPRIATNLSIHLADQDEARTVANLSLGGFALDGPVDGLVAGAELPVVLHLGPGHVIRARARIVRNEAEATLGAAFVSLSIKAREALDWFIMLHEQPVRVVRAGAI